MHVGLWTLSAALASEAWDPSYAALVAFYDGAVDARGVDYALLGSRRSALDAWVRAAADAPVATMSRDDQLAFWIDAYNALTVRLILDERLPGSIRDLDGGAVWTTRAFLVGGEPLTLDQIEHQRVRSFGDPRVHAVLHCASRGCPPLPPEPVRGATLAADLDAGVRRWASANAFAWSDDTLLLSPVFDWYAADFVGASALASPDAAVAFLAPFVDPATAARMRAAPKAWGPYDWSLNRR